MVTTVNTSEEDRAMFARSIRAARDARRLSREAVVYELTRLGNQVSVSSLLRWEKEGTIKAEDAYYLSKVYGMTIDELLLTGEPEDPVDRHGAILESADVASSKDSERGGKSRRRRRSPPSPKQDE